VDILYEFHPFVFGGVSQPGNYSASLPLKTPPSTLLSTHGRLFGIFTIRYPEVFPLESIAKEILPYFEKLYYESDCFSVHSHLVHCLTETQNYLEKRILDVNGVDSVDFSILVGSVWGSVLYLARCGGLCGLRLYRSDSFGVLFDITNTSGSSGVSSLSGFIESHDVVVLYDALVAVSKFPLNATSVSEVDKQVVYTKLTQLFEIPQDAERTGTVSGFYIAEDKVPSVDEERVVFADVAGEQDLEVRKPEESSRSESEVSSESYEEEERSEAPAVFQKVLAGPASM
jgi:hypothetical protein